MPHVKTVGSMTVHWVHLQIIVCVYRTTYIDITQIQLLLFHQIAHINDFPNHDVLCNNAPFMYTTRHIIVIIRCGQCRIHYVYIYKKYIIYMIWFDKNNWKKRTIDDFFRNKWIILGSDPNTLRQPTIMECNPKT